MRLNGAASRRPLGTQVLLLEILPPRAEAEGDDGLVPSTRAARGGDWSASEAGTTARGRDVVVAHGKLRRSWAVMQAHDGETACRGEGESGHMRGISHVVMCRVGGG